MQAILVGTAGGPEVLSFTDVPDPIPGVGQALVRIEAAGLNFIDVYQRTGLYPMQLPVILGSEAAGTVTAVGPGVSTVRVGDRVAYQGVLGAYAQLAAVPADRLLPLPDGVTTHEAAALMLQGMTAHYLALSTFPLSAGDTCLVHAAAGGVGLLLVQIAKMRGARVIGTVSTEAKARLAREAGADEIIVYTSQDFVAETKRLTQDRGVQVVYDSVGRTTFDGSLAVLAPRGMMVLFGQSSGPVPPFDPQILARRGSLFLTRPILGAYVATREALLARSHDLCTWMAAGQLRVRVDHVYPLAQAADAHRALEGRQTTGKLVLIP